MKGKRIFTDSPGKILLLYAIAYVQKHNPEYRKGAEKGRQVMKLEQTSGG